MEGRWCSAAQVAADLSRAGGGGAPPAPRALADACLPWDARPAPITRTEREHECGEWEEERAAGERAASPPPPDLHGITRMLRMIQTVDTDEDPTALYGGGLFISRPPAPPPRPQDSPRARTHPATHHANGSDATAVNTTSSLNPDVAEFVPRGGGAEGGASAREQAAARLRDDICGGRDRCSAIARLMRLYAEPDCEPDSTPRLLTPDYFERPPAPERACGADSTHENTSGSIPHEPAGAQPAPAAQPADVRLSVDKVRRWLGGGEASPRATPSPSALLLTPVTFRARAPPRPPSPTAAPRPARVTPAYVPPPGAMEALQREYAARIAAAAAQPTAAAGDTLWSRLEPQLRQKDAERRARDVGAGDTLWSRLEPQLRQKDAERRARDAAAADH